MTVIHARDMSTHASETDSVLPHSNQAVGTPASDSLDVGRQVLIQAGAALKALSAQLDGSFIAALDLIAQCRGHVVVTGVGKSGLVGQKISATLASTGCPSFFMHAAEAAHGDLGRLRPDDVVLALSNSGESAELCSLLGPIRSLKTPLIALTGKPHSTLGRQAAVVLAVGAIDEACPMGLVPTTSTTVMMAMGDALAMALMTQRKQLHELYARLHPGGSLGRQLRDVASVMRQGEAMPLASVHAPLREVLTVMTETVGRPGAAMLIDDEGRLAGLFTDGDLRRILKHQDFCVDGPVCAVMHANPKTVAATELVAQAAALLRRYRIDQVPVVDADNRPVGLLDVQDVLSLNVS